MAEQTFLAKLGMRLGVLGSSASLALAAPLANGDYNITANTDATRIGVYFDRTASAEAVVFNVMGTDRVRIGVTGIEVPSGSISIGITYDASTKLNVAACTTAFSSLRLNPGTAPTSPFDGDLWITASGFYGHINGSTVLFSSGSIGGSIAANQVAYGLGANTIQGAAALTFDGTNLSTTGRIFTGNGLVNAPAYSFTSDSDTGMYRAGADDLGFAVNGTLTLEIATTAVTSAVIGIFPASTTAAASIRLPHGTAPTSPTNGDFWTVTAGAYAHIDGDTYNLIGSLVATVWPAANAAGVLTNDGAGALSWAASGGGIGGAATATQVSYGSGPNTLTSNAAFTYITATNLLSNIATATGGVASRAASLAVNHTSSGTHSTAMSAVRGTCTQTGTGTNTNEIVSGDFSAINSNTAGTASFVYGVRGAATANGSGGTTTSLYGGTFTIDVQAGAIVSDAFGIYIIGNNGGTVSNYYGLYQSDSAALNHFDGVLSVGIAAATSTYLNLGIGTTGKSSLRMGHGAPPSVPVNGDFWTTAAGGLFGRINGVTINYGSAAPGGANTQVQFNNSGTFGGSANLTWDGTTFAIVGKITDTLAVTGVGASTAHNISMTATNSLGGAGLVAFSASTLITGSATTNSNGYGGKFAITTTNSAHTTSEFINGLAVSATVDAPLATGVTVYGLDVTCTGTSGSVNTAKGVQITMDLNSTLATAYGLYINSFGSATASIGQYAIFAAGGVNYFNGHTSIGNFDPKTSTLLLVSDDLVPVGSAVVRGIEVSSNANGSGTGNIIGVDITVNGNQAGVGASAAIGIQASATTNGSGPTFDVLGASFLATASAGTIGNNLAGVSIVTDNEVSCAQSYGIKHSGTVNGGTPDVRGVSSVMTLFSTDSTATIAYGGRFEIQHYDSGAATDSLIGVAGVINIQSAAAFPPPGTCVRAEALVVGTAQSITGVSIFAQNDGTINGDFFGILIDFSESGTTVGNKFGIYSGSSALNHYLNGVVGVGVTPFVVGSTAWLRLGAIDTNTAHINFLSGAEPSSPNDGDMWYTGAVVKFRVGGVTKTFTLI